MSLSGQSTICKTEFVMFVVCARGVGSLWQIAWQEADKGRQGRQVIMKLTFVLVLVLYQDPALLLVYFIFAALGHVFITTAIGYYLNQIMKYI